MAKARALSARDTLPAPSAQFRQADFAELGIADPAGEDGEEEVASDGVSDELVVREEGRNGIQLTNGCGHLRGSFRETVKTGDTVNT
jgi:hypothetical protein